MNTVILKGEPHSLRFEFEALCLMQERYGVNVFAPSTWEPSPRTVAVLLWGGLQHLGPKAAPTLESIMKGLDMKDYRATSDAAYAALGEALPKKAEVDANASA